MNGRGRKTHLPKKKLCAKCGIKSGNIAVSNKDLCKGCLAVLPEVRNSPRPPHPRQRRNRV